MMDDKKKMIVLGALLVVILGVGAFQMTAGSAPAPAPAPAKKERPKAQPEAEHAKPGLVLDEKTGQAIEAPAVDPALVAIATLGARDPFDGRRYSPQAAATQPAAQNTALPKPPRSNYSYPAPKREIGGTGGNWGSGSGGNTPLPVAGPDGQPSGNIGVAPGAKITSPDDFNYRVSGVITGSKNAAVFTDGQGNQRLITAGSSIDGDSQLVSVGRGKVTVRHRGKLKTFNVGGD